MKTFIKYLKKSLRIGAIIFTVARIIKFAIQEFEKLDKNVDPFNNLELEKEETKK